MGGGQVYLLRQLSQLDPARFEPIVLCPMEGVLTDFLRQSGVRVHILPIHQGLINLRKEDLLKDLISIVKNPFRLLSGVWRLASWLRREKVTLVHLNSMKAGFYGGMAARLAGVPTVWDFKDILSEDFFPSFNRKLVVLVGNTCTDAVVANSHIIGRTFIGQGGRQGKVIVIHNGINLDEFCPDSPASDIRLTLGFTDKTPVVSIFSRLDRWKGHTYFLEAAAQTSRVFPDARFLVVGATTFDDEAYATELIRLTESLGLTDRVHYLGFREDIASLMAASDLIVHASTLPEPLGLTPMEAQAAGRPVVAVGAGGVLETVAHEETGLLIPPKDASAMANALITLLGDPARCKLMGQAGRARAEALFDLKINARKVQDVYLGLIER